ncbi:MAG TPA: acetyl-CoA carboxylase biotin carboxyl carrier protein [Candidatus Sulfotelmatobacter sp.]|nr:acetyl-CoA carboxylase biotin carboxyl carrier protein [Candidatus Sulfotelmatobacter sp.]
MNRHQVDAELIRKLAALLDETGLTELEYQTSALRVRVAKNHVGSHGGVMVTPPPAAGPVPAESAPAAPTADHPGAIISPMVGTAYCAPEPGAAAFVRVGDAVRQGQTLLIIEAMKVMNPVPAPRAGTVTEILVRDAQPVEYGEVLLVIE